MKILNNDTYLLLIDEKSRGIEFGEIGVNMRHSKLEVETRNMGGYGSDKYYWCHKKCLAYYPLSKEAKELDLPLLPPFEEVDIEKLANDKYPVSPQKRKIFIEGYKAAQSKGQYSLEDMEKAFESGYNSAKNYSYKSNGTYQEDFEKFIQSLSIQQLPVNFIPELERDFSNRSCSNCNLYISENTCEEGLQKKCVTATKNEKHGDYWLSCLDDEEDAEIYKLKTIINPLGQRVVQGKYEFNYD